MAKKTPDLTAEIKRLEIELADLRAQEKRLAILAEIDAVKKTAEELERRILERTRMDKDFQVLGVLAMCSNKLRSLGDLVSTANEPTGPAV